MKSYKCPQCGIVSLATQTHCKSCHAPNPNPVNALETYTRPIPAVSTTAAYQTSPPPTYQQSPCYNENSYNSPPPPTMFGDEYGTAYGTAVPRREGFSSRSRNQYAGDYSVEMQSAEDDIRKAWKAGRAWCILVGLLGGLLAVILLVASPSPFLVIIPFLVLAPLFAIVGGLSYGVFKKSRACAVILLCLTGLGLLSNILTLATDGGKAIVPLIMSILFFYYFSLGVRGTFKYHKLMQA